jgi:hypothetical protein
MALLGSVAGLASAVNNKVGALTSVAQGVLCIPSILTGLPGILGNVAGSLLSSLQNQALGVMSSIVSISCSCGRKVPDRASSWR